MKCVFVLPNCSGKITKSVLVKLIEILAHFVTMPRKNGKRNAEVVEMLQVALEAGKQVWDTVNKFLDKLLEASAAVGLLPEVKALFDHMCQGK